MVRFTDELAAQGPAVVYVIVQVFNELALKFTKPVIGSIVIPAGE